MTDHPSSATPEIVTLEAAPTAVVRGVVPTAELPSFFDRSFDTLGSTLSGLGAHPVGPAFAWYDRPPGATSDLAVGFPVGHPLTPTGDVVPSSLPGGRVATVEHIGGYDGLAQAWAQLRGWIAQHGLTVAEGCWEVYLTEPTPDGDPAANRTRLYQPLREG